MVERAGAQDRAMRAILARTSSRAVWARGSRLGITILFGGCCAVFPAALRGQTKAPVASPRVPVEKLTFNQNIQPILSENCYPCHGPDPGARKAKMRLDRAEFAYAPHDKSGPAIIPGQPDKSPLVRKIEAKNPKDRMPPPEAHKTLKPEQIAVAARVGEAGCGIRRALVVSCAQAAGHS